MGDIKKIIGTRNAMLLDANGNIIMEINNFLRDNNININRKSKSFINLQNIINTILNDLVFGTINYKRYREQNNKDKIIPITSLTRNELINIMEKYDKYINDLFKDDQDKPLSLLEFLSNNIKE
jgi:hypothetical protein